ncbi:MAG: hypothetical protein DRH15_02990 [Deltaproteobacteria bacterium]|nr:MAG: hypothetical protein DRH15_02990 [Deltaproteobacteria bacterium]
MCEANTVKLLTAVMAQAVPEVCVTRAKVSCWVEDGVKAYFLTVYPDHVEYWLRFHRRYPHYKRVALRYGVEKQSINSQCCPEFPTWQDLINWLVDVLGLSQGERNLLHLCIMK